MNIEVTQITPEVEPIIEEKTAKKKPMPKQVPLKYSNFFITINSNKNMNNMPTDLYQSTLSKFKSSMELLFNEKIKEFIILSGSKIAIPYGLDRNAPRVELEKRITKAVIEFTIEIGPESGKLHCHALVGLQKRGVDSKLDYTAIRQWLEQELGYVCHFQSTLYRDAKQSLQNYISKSPIN